jgi:uncharacterized membrane protein YkoI
MPESGATVGKQARRSYRRALLCLAFAALAAVSPAQADRGGRDGDSRGADRAASERKDTGAAHAAQIAESRYGGKALKVSPKGGGAYNVRLLLPDGTVKSVTVNAGD